MHHLPGRLENLRERLAQQLTGPGPGQDGNLTGQNVALYGDDADAIACLSNREHFGPQQGGGAMAFRQLQIGRDAGLDAQIAAARLEIPDLVVIGFEVWIAATQFSGRKHFMGDTEAPGRRDGAIEEAGTTWAFDRIIGPGDDQAADFVQQ
ncbi:hypothetical protein ABIB57_004031 [Devosia sp. UYZn731]